MRGARNILFSLIALAASLEAAPAPAKNTAGAPEKASDLRRQALVLVSSGALAQALPLYYEALTLQPSNYTLLYETGTLERRSGNAQSSRRNFELLLKYYPGASDAFEGLALACLSLGEHRQAADYLEQWNAKSPGSAYILGLLARAYSKMDEKEKAANIYSEIINIEPKNIEARRRLSDLRQTYGHYLTPYARSYRSVGPEGLDTPNPQRIIYEGQAVGSNINLEISKLWKAALAFGASQEAQRNQTRGFTYYNMLDQTAQAGAQAKWAGGSLELMGGWSWLSDIEEAGVGQTKILRWKASGSWLLGPADLTVKTSQGPKFLRGANESQFFTILRERSAGAAITMDLWKMNWRLRGGIDHYSEGTQWISYSALGRYETGSHLWQASGSRSQQEFFGATDQGTIGFVNVHGGGLRYRYWKPENYRFLTAYSYDGYSDQNHLEEWNAEASKWLTPSRELVATYRFSNKNFQRPSPGYRNTGEESHWLSAAWQHGWTAGWWTTIELEPGRLSDDVRGRYESLNASAQLEWHFRNLMTWNLTGKIGESTLDDHSYSVRLEGRINF